MVPFFASPSQPQEENDDADLSDLCQRCREIDLNLIFNRGSRPRRTISSILQTVLCLGQLDGESSCALCRFFASMRRHNPSLQPPTGPYHLRRYDMLCVSGEGWKWDYKQSFPLWAVEQGSGDEFEDHHPGYYTTPRGSIGSWILPTRSTPDPSPFLEALPVIDTSVNYPLLRRWIEGCEGHSICQKTPLDFEPTRGRKRPPIRGINCTTRRIEMIADDDTYLALSYVWGNMSLPAVNGEENNRSLPATAIRVVEDAMMVVKELGHRYLWVDQYCIDQNDEKNKEAQIGNMDQIYERAHATIVAFSGINSSCGLPGVNGSSRIQQYHFNSSKMNLIGLTPGLTAKVAKASVWTQRGWTFQEALLSRRLLIFAQDQAYFLCASGHWAEGCTP
ncbi:heterokaryon incompatibility protein-domain-containing protein, partial [Sordaria brevicollis]